jgi:hypothetical protein
MRWLRSYRGRVLAFLLALIVALVVVYAVGAIKNNGTSSSGSASSSGIASTSTAKGTEEEDGPASFIGRASNAVMFIQWTRSGGSVTGSLREAISKRESLSLESADRAFTGVITGKGITLNLSGALGESTAFVGEVKEDGFTLTVPGQGSNLITINFEPGEVSGYDEATKQLLLAKYPSPCSLYVVSHEVRISFSGPNSAEDCASFVQRARSNTEWTTAPQSGAESGSVVCELENRDSEKVIITDNGGQAYGKEACNQLSGEGWG